jgi:hypothetical protein
MLGLMEKTRQTARNQFLELPLQKNQSISAGGRNGLYKPSRIPLRRFGAVEPPLRPQHTQTSKICEQATQYNTPIERSGSHQAVTQQHESDDGAQIPSPQSQKSNNTGTDRLVSPSLNRQHLRRPTLTSP